MSEVEPGRRWPAKVLTVSDGVVAGTREDRSGAALADRLGAAGYEVVSRSVSADGAELLSRQSWRGNVRELRNFVLRLALLSREDTIDAAAIAPLLGGLQSSDIAAGERAAGIGVAAVGQGQCDRPHESRDSVLSPNHMPLKGLH